MKDIAIETISNEAQTRKKTLKMNRAAITCGGNTRWSNRHAIRLTECEWTKNIWSYKCQNFPNLIITAIPQNQSPSKWITTKKNALTYNIIILPKTNDKEKNLHSNLKVHHKRRKKDKNILEFLSKTAQGRRQWIEIPKILHENPVIIHNGILYPVEIALKRKAK